MYMEQAYVVPLLGAVTYTLTYPTGATLPTDSEILIDLGDGTTLGPIPLPFTGPGPHSYSFSHTFTDDGDYETSVTISNLASFVELVRSVSKDLVCELGIVLSYP